MKPIGIITDSHSGITPGMAKVLGISVLSMPFYIEGECYYENLTLTREDFFQKLTAGADVSTSQPSPAAVMQIWDAALLEYEQVLYLPLSSGLSGSCATATALSQEECYEGRVFVVDNGRVSALLHRSVLDAIELVEEGYSAEEIKTILESSRADMVIYVAVDNLIHLKRGGRISPAAASIGTLLNVKPVLKFDVGALDSFKNCRGFVKAKKAMLEAVKNDLQTTFREAFEHNEIYLVAASSSSKEATGAWIREIQSAFPGMEVMCDDLPLGISCHIGAGGLGIGISCRPKRPAGSQMHEIHKSA